MLREICLFTMTFPMATWAAMAVSLLLSGAGVDSQVLKTRSDVCFHLECTEWSPSDGSCITGATQTRTCTESKAFLQFLVSCRLFIYLSVANCQIVSLPRSKYRQFLHSFRRGQLCRAGGVLLAILRSSKNVPRLHLQKGQGGVP